MSGGEKGSTSGVAQLVPRCSRNRYRSKIVSIETVMLDDGHFGVGQRQQDVALLRGHRNSCGHRENPLKNILPFDGVLKEDIARRNAADFRRAPRRSFRRRFQSGRRRYRRQATARSGDHGGRRARQNDRIARVTSVRACGSHWRSVQLVGARRAMAPRAVSGYTDPYRDNDCLSALHGVLE